MEEISVESRISVIEKLGVGINHAMGGNYTEAIVAELVSLLKSRTTLAVVSPATDTQQPHTAICNVADCFMWDNNCKKCSCAYINAVRGKQQ